jgi:hypothetical protein
MMSPSVFDVIEYENDLPQGLVKTFSEVSDTQGFKIDGSFKCGDRSYGMEITKF